MKSLFALLILAALLSPSARAERGNCANEVAFQHKEMLPTDAISGIRLLTVLPRGETTFYSVDGARRVHFAVNYGGGVYRVTYTTGRAHVAIAHLVNRRCQIVDSVTLYRR